MKVIEFSKLYKYDYNIDIVEFRFTYSNNAKYDCSIDGRGTNSFLYYADIETVHTLKDKVYHFKKDDFIYFPVGLKYSSVFTVDKKSENDFNGIQFGFLLKDKSGEHFRLSEDIIIISEQSRKKYKNRMFEIAYMINSNKPPMLIKAKLGELLTDISIALNEKDKSQDYLRIIDGIKFIEENFDKKITAKDAAEICFLSESHFRMLFTKHFQVPPAKYINELKIKKATDLLKSGLYTIVEVSKMIGIDSPSYFSWFYKKHTNINPSEVIGRGNIDLEEGEEI